jgi:hypothetical protein
LGEAAGTETQTDDLSSQPSENGISAAGKVGEGEGRGESGLFAGVSGFLCSPRPRSTLLTVVEYQDISRQIYWHGQLWRGVYIVMESTTRIESADLATPYGNQKAPSPA